MKPGIKGRMETIVTEAMTAKAVGSGELMVYATPMMIALVEETAWRSVAGELGEGQSTVGTRMEISHISATPVGMGVVCETELIEVDRRKLVFSVNVCDQAGKIAEGIHERFIVDTERFMEKAENKSE